MIESTFAFELLLNYFEVILVIFWFRRESRLSMVGWTNGDQASNEAAAESRTRWALGWERRAAEGGSGGGRGAERVRMTTSALEAPVAMRMILRAERMEPTPMVMARVGTSSMLLKKRALACRVDSVSGTQAVAPSMGAPGSLNPMCPFKPMPRI